MIAILRKNFAYLYSTNKPCVPSALSPPRFFSTLRACPRVYDLLFHKHQFSAEVASQVASNLALPETTQNADSILSFLKDSGCSTTQLEKLVKYKPRLLLHSVEDIKFKFKIFQDLGLSPQDTAKMISSSKVILHLGANSNIIPSLSVLKGLLGSDYDVATLLRKSAWPLYANLETTLLPNVEFLKSLGIPMERILYFLYSYPRSLLIKPDVMRQSVEKAREMGFDESSKMFTHALKVITSMSKGMWEVKLQSFQEMGFSESDSLKMFKKYPYVFNVSMKKIEKIQQLLLATGKFDMPSIVDDPGIFGCSIEQRILPRLRILESKNLEKWPSLGTIRALSEEDFLKRYVGPYLTEVGEAFATKSCVKDKN